MIETVVMFRLIVSFENLRPIASLLPNRSTFLIKTFSFFNKISIKKNLILILKPKQN
jgi:hypothetical protein